MPIRIDEYQLRRDLYKKNKIAAKNLRTLRILAGLSQQALADLLHISRSTYFSLEHEGKSPDYETLLILSDFYEVDLGYMISYDIAEQMLNMIRVNQEDINALTFMSSFFALSRGGKEEISKEIARIKAYEDKYNHFPWRYEGHEEFYTAASLTGKMRKFHRMPKKKTSKNT